MDFSVRQTLPLVIATFMLSIGLFSLYQNLRNTGERFEEQESILVAIEYAMDQEVDNDPALRPTIHNVDNDDFISVDRNVVLINTEEVATIDFANLFEFRDYKNAVIPSTNIRIRGEERARTLNHQDKVALEFKACDVEGRCQRFRVKIQASDSAKKRG